MSEIHFDTIFLGVEKEGGWAVVGEEGRTQSGDISKYFLGEAKFMRGKRWMGRIVLRRSRQRVKSCGRRGSQKMGWKDLTTVSDEKRHPFGGVNGCGIAGSKGASSFEMSRKAYSSKKGPKDF